LPVELKFQVLGTLSSKLRKKYVKKYIWKLMGIEKWANELKFTFFIFLIEVQLQMFYHLLFYLSIFYIMNNYIFFINSWWPECPDHNVQGNAESDRVLPCHHVQHQRPCSACAGTWSPWCRKAGTTTGQIQETGWVLMMIVGWDFVIV
jgi:hypothetical protein